MAVKVRPFKPNTSNAQILDAIRHTASNDYQRRVPNATKADVQATIKAMWDYTPTRNEFMDAFINQIGLIIARNTNWTNPLAKFKRGLLEYGDTIEEVQTGLVEAYVYDPTREYLERDIFGQAIVDTQSSFHKVNRENFYKISINEALLKRAFLSNEGLASYANQLMSVPSTSDNFDEWLLTVNLFSEFYDNGGFFKVQIPDIGSATATNAQVKTALRAIRSYASTLPFLSTRYNAAGMPVHANPEDLELFVTPNALSAIDVEALAAAFNIERAAVPMRITVIPEENWNIPGGQAILTTKDFFVIADTLYETRSQINPVSMTTNYFLHHWQIISASRFVPAILFTTEPGTVIELDETPVDSVGPLTTSDADGVTVTELLRGNFYQVNGEAVTLPAGGYNDAVRLELVGTVPLSVRTYVTQTGAVYIAPDEDNENVTIRAIATDDATEFATLARPINGDKLQLWPNPSVIDD